jgi:hypothetical protein
MSDIDLDKLERLARAATPGPWRQREQRDDGSTLASYEQGCFVESPNMAGEDAAYIAAANPSVVLALIERLRRLGEVRNILFRFACADAAHAERPCPHCQDKDDGEPQY